MTSIRWLVAYVWPLLIGGPSVPHRAAPAESFRGSAAPPAARSDRLPDSDEVGLALSAGPRPLTTGAAVYLWRDGRFTKVRTGTTGFACMVSRDARASGVFPMCFDPEGARTLMHEEMMKTQLRAQGSSNAAVVSEVAAAYRHGSLHHPEKPAIIYMMSSRQVLVDYDGETTQRVGAWHPHVMIYLPHASASQLALGPADAAVPLSTADSDGGVLLVVQVPHWADVP